MSGGGRVSAQGAPLTELNDGGIAVPFLDCDVLPQQKFELDPKELEAGGLLRLHAPRRLHF